MATIIGARWKALDEASRAYYENLAAQDKLRYKRELEAYQKRQAAAREQGQDNNSQVQ